MTVKSTLVRLWRPRRKKKRGPSLISAMVAISTPLIFLILPILASAVQEDPQALQWVGIMISNPLESLIGKYIQLYIRNRATMVDHTVLRLGEGNL